jgi:hypothetical protein
LPVDANDNPIPDAAVGILADGTALGAVTDNADGTYSATYTAGTSAGEVVLSFTVGGTTAANTATLTLTPGAAAKQTSSISADVTVIASDGVEASTITITVRDSNGNAVPNAAVYVDLSGPGMLSQIGQVTANSNGQLQTILRSTSRGSGTVTAYIGSDQNADGLIGSVVVTYLVDAQKVIDTFQDVTGAFISRRMDQIIANQPRAWTLDRRRAATGVPQVSMKAGGVYADPVIDVVMEYGRVTEDQKWYVWSELVFSRYADSSGALDTRKGSFGMLSLGADYLVLDNLSIGLMGQVDRATESIADFADVRGTGWLIGPYLSMEISPELFFNARASFGRSSNTASIDVFEDSVFFSGRFKTSRALVQASLKGRYDLGRAILYPDAEMTYMRESQGGYSVTDGVFNVDVPGLRAELGRFSLGGTVDLPYATANSNFVVYARPQLDWNFNRLGAARNLETWRGSLELGLRTDAATAWDGELSVRYDGIGTGSFRAIAARASFGMRF